jgi:hypothetical protein
MPVAGGPKITTTGILLEVDAANASSYISGSSTWVNVFRPGTRNGTINGTIGFSPTDNYGALTYPGTTSSYVDFGNIGDLSVSWSFQVAVKPAPSSSGNYTILSYASGSNTGSWTYKLDYSSSNQSAVLSVYSATGSARAVHQVTGSVPTGSWSIINASYGNSVVGMYVNGQPTDYVVTTGSVVGYNSSNRLYLGGTFGITSSYYTGSMASFFSYNTDVPNTQLIQNYNAYATRFGLPPSILAPVATDPDALRFIEIAEITNSTQAAAVNNLVGGLKANNLWTKMQAIYPFVGGTAYSHKFNLKDPLLYPVSWAGGINHTSLGIVTTATNAIGYTGIVPRTAVADVSSSVHISINLNTNSSASTNTIIGNSDLPNAAGEYKKSINIAQGYFGNTAIQYAAFAATSLSNTRLGNGQGLWVSTRVGNIIYGYRRSAVQTINNSGGPYNFDNFYPNNQIQLLQGNSYGGGPAGMIVNCATVGDGLTQTDVDNLYTLLNTYNTSLSRL